MRLTYGGEPFQFLTLLGCKEGQELAGLVLDKYPRLKKLVAISIEWWPARKKWTMFYEICTELLILVPRLALARIRGPRGRI